LIYPSYSPATIIAQQDSAFDTGLIFKKHTIVQKKKQMERWYKNILCREQNKFLKITAYPQKLKIGK
jgi:hypothetical protein